MKNMIKMLAALMAVMVLVLAVPAAFAEEAPAAEPTPEVQAPAEPKHEEPKAEEPKAEAPAEPEATVEPAAEPTVEATAEATPAAEPTVEATADATPAAEPEATPAAEVTATPERSVRIISDDASLTVGETLTLTAKLSGFDGVEFKLTWQIKTQGDDWKDISGEHGETLKVKQDDESIGASWRVIVETAD